MGQETLRLTMEQRIAALERANVVLRDRTKVLRCMLKDQGELISECIRQAMAGVGGDAGAAAIAGPNETMYASVCHQRFERMERRLNELRDRSTEGAAIRRAV